MLFVPSLRSSPASRRYRRPAVVAVAFALSGAGVSLPGAGRYRSGIGVIDGEAADRDTCRMAVRVLGPVGIDGAGPLEPRDRIALGVLAVRNGVTVSPEQLADALWGDDPPQSWRKQVQIRVSRLRKVLDEDAIETTADGYRLTLEGADVDASQFERLVERGRVLVAGGEPDRAAATYHRALALWQGAPLTDLDGWLPGRSEASRLEELRRSAQEDWLVARLAAGEHRDVAAAAEPLVDEEPLRERRWALLALAQYRCARQADALRTLARARRTLAEVGLEPGVDLLELEAAILRQDPALAPATAPAVVSAACPYKGLAPYDRADSEAFFGRADDVQVCLDRLRASPLLVVAGPSGCGKSSLVRAGLVPALAGRGRVATVFTPGPDLAEAMARSSEARGAAPVLVVDQFEELFTHGLPIEAVRSFCQALARYALETAPVVIAVRSDQLGGLSVDAGLSSLAEHGLHLLAPLAGEALREAIEQPALLAGLRLEHGLVDLLVRDCEGEPGGLPLLSHALAETWRRRDGQTLTVAGYRDSGGIRGAVARSADRLYDGLSAGERASLRSVLLRLVSPTPDGDAVRYRVPSRALLGEPGREHVISLMVGARLLTAENETFEIAHEALARAWPRLRSWLEEDVAGQRLLRHLVSAADGWDSLGRPDTELYRGARLETALEWREHSDRQLTAVEQEFLDASAEQAASERRALESRARRDARNNRRLVALLGAARGPPRRGGRGWGDRGPGVAAGSSRRRRGDRPRARRGGRRQRRHRPGAQHPARPRSGRARPNRRQRRPCTRPRKRCIGAVSAARIAWRVTGTGGAVDWSPDGSHVITEGLESSGLIDIRDAATGEAVRSFAASDGEVTDVSLRPDGHTAGHHQRRRDRCGVGQHHRRAPPRRGRSGRRAGMGTLVQPGRATVCCGLASRRRRPRAHHARLDGRDRPRAPWDSGREEHVVLPRRHQARGLVGHRTDRRHHRRRLGRRAGHARRKTCRASPRWRGVPMAHRSPRRATSAPPLRRDIRSRGDGARGSRILCRGHRLEPRLDPVGHRQRRRHGNDLEPHRRRWAGDDHPVGDRHSQRHQ